MLVRTLHACLRSFLPLSSCLASSSSMEREISMMYEDRQYCAFMSSKCCFSSLAAASLAGCVFKVRTLPSILLRMRVMCAPYLAIFLEICGVVAFLHSLLMSEIVVSDKFADAILVFCCCAEIRCVFVTCVALQRLQVCLLGRLPFFVCFLVLSICYLQISVRMLSLIHI